MRKEEKRRRYEERRKDVGKTEKGLTRKVKARMKVKGRNRKRKK